MFEMLVLLYARSDDAASGTLAGKRICRPEGFAVDAPDEGPTEGLGRAGSPEGCFARLMEGAVDLVALNEFTGRIVLREMGLTAAVAPVAGPALAIETLHVVAHRSNPVAAAQIARVDAGLLRMQDSGAFRDILGRHLTDIGAEY